MKKFKKIMLTTLSLVAILLVIMVITFNLDSDKSGKYCTGFGTQDPFSTRDSDCICIGEKNTYVSVGATKVTCDGFVLLRW